MVVTDASVLTDALVVRERFGLRAALGTQTLHAPALVDYEVMSALRGLVRGGHLGAARAADALIDFADLALRRYPATKSLRADAWALRERLTVYDASYVALARALGAPLWTLDLRLARACPPEVDVVTW